ncbi:MAG: response regulator [Gemmatimonadetes bacterium]|nr:response regulator [Gemmatimonadota bacterium]
MATHYAPRTTHHSPTFTRLEDSTELEPKSPLESVGAAPEEPVQILLVDDQPVNLEALELMLAPSGCKCVRAKSADEALLALLDQDFAAIVLDIRMPGMTGLELASLIKRRRRTEHVPILFLTAHMADEKEIIRGYGTGAVDYLTKPVSPEILRSKVAVFIDLFRKTRALARANEALQREIAERQWMEEALREANQELEVRVQERTAALREADRRKDEFLAALAHELRNPLAALYTAAEVYRLKAPSGTDLAGPQGVIERQLQQMTRLVGDLLDVSRITRDKLILQKSRVELAKVVADAVETSRPIIEQREHALVVNVPAEPVTVEADQVRLAQVFSNLLDNAAKYTEPGGRIKLSAERHDNDVVVRVEDTGIGIEPEALPRIFDLFMQADNAHDRARSGLGIGLTLVRRLVEMHGGSVSGQSEGSGKGSTFAVRLPILMDAPAQQEQDRLEPDRLVLEQSLRILIVEDNVDAAEMLNAMLTAWGQETRVAHDGVAALEVAGQFRPQIVLLDIGLPQFSGYDVARRLRAQSWGKSILLVAVTGWGQEIDRQRSKAAGFDHHFLKPVDPGLLRRLLASYRAPVVLAGSRAGVSGSGSRS